MNKVLPLAHQTITSSDGVKLHAVTCGAGRLILFLHGFPEHWEAWSSQLQRFGRENLAAAIDMRGYNLSEKPSEVTAYTLPRLVEDIRCVVDALSPNEPAVIVGHDWGGIAAWAFAREHPDRLDRLIAINAPHPAIFARELADSADQRFASSYALLFRSPTVAEEILASFDYALLRKMVFKRTMKPEAFPEEKRVAYLEAWRQPGALRSALKYYSASQSFAEYRGQNWQIRTPTLVLWGDADPALLTGNLRGLEEYVPELWVQRHPTATHWVTHEEPEWVNTHIEDFIRDPASGNRWSLANLGRAVSSAN